MKKAVFTSLALLSLYGCEKPTNVNDNIDSAEEAIAVKSAMKFEHQGFDCIGEFEKSLPLLGRGEDFPQFLLQDIHDELVRQDSDSRLISAKCLGEPELKAGFVDATIAGETQQVLDTLVVGFPLEIFADTGSELWYMDINMGYTVKGLVEEGTPTVTKNFNVLQTYNKDRKPLTKMQVTVVDEESGSSEDADSKIN